MKYVITGSLGHISKPVVSALVNAGHDVTVISSNGNRTKDIKALGAKAAVGSVEDPAFLQKTFAGADIAYTMVPPNYGAADVKGHIAQVGKNYAAAITGSTIKHIVNLSSIGAHLPDGVGPVSGLHRVELALNALPGVHIKHLRPSYFYYNLMGMLSMVKHMGVMGSNFSVAAGKFPIVDPADIAVVAEEELLALNFTGHSFRYIASDETGTDAIAAAIGKAIGKPDLKWAPFTDEQALGGMQQGGLPGPMALSYIEMGQAIDSGAMFEDYWKHRPAKFGKTKLDDFAKAFAAAYNAG